jgi:hypothetical protein
MEFWSVVESSTVEPFNVEAASVRLVSALSAMAPSDVLDFCDEFDRKMDEAYTWQLRGVPYLINSGCSDDSFMDFRSSLIAQGRTVYDQVISDAESLMELDKEQLTEMFEEGYLYAPTSAYE